MTFMEIFAPVANTNLKLIATMTKIRRGTVILR